MKQSKSARNILTVILSLCVVWGSGFFVMANAEVADPAQQESSFQEFAIISGYANSNLEDLADYEVVPLILRFGFDITPFLERHNISLPGVAQLDVEPFVGLVTSPNTNAELGCQAVVKYAYPVTKRVSPYIECGLGAIYMSQHTREQATEFNLVSHVGAGAYYFLKDNLAVSAGYRFRHISNADIEKPNKGIETGIIIGGVSFFY